MVTGEFSRILPLSPTRSNPMSHKHRYPARTPAEEAARRLVDQTGRHHAIWATARDWRVVPLHSFADRWLRATLPGTHCTRVLATREQRERRRRPRLLALFPQRERTRFREVAHTR